MIHLISVSATSLSFQLTSNFVSSRTNTIPTLARVNEEANPHDIEYPDIPSIPEESEEELPDESNWREALAERW